VVGGGPAGLSAATWLARHRRRVFVLDGGEYRNELVERTHGYLGRDNTDPKDLLARARSELVAYPTAQLQRGRATSARTETDGTFSLDFEDGGDSDNGSLSTRRVVLATGVVDLFPEVDGFFDHYGASVFHCPTCDGYEARDRHVVVLGWSADVAGYALTLLDWAADVTIVTDGTRFEGDRARRAALDRHGVAILEDDAVAFLGTRGDLQGVRLRGGQVLTCDLAFFSIGHRPRTDLAVQLGCELTEQGCITVDDECRTTVAGVYAAGDVTPGIQLVQVAAAKGTIAGVTCAISLRGEPAAPGAPEPGPDVEAELAGEG
jgi:thioredoxin reductase